MICDVGLLAILRVILRDSIVNAKVGLYDNDLEPTEETVLADLTEASFDGYAQQTTRSLTWPNPAINVNGEAETDGPTITFTSTGDTGFPLTIYGLFVTIDDDVGAPILFMAFKFDVAAEMEMTGDAVQKKINWFADQY